MDAYVFAGTATDAAVEALRGAASPAGPVRVVCPLSGDRELYVALTAADPAALSAAVDDVLATEGLTDADTVLTDDADGSASFPTYLAVAAQVGFTLLDLGEAQVRASVAAVAALPVVAGIAVVQGGAQLLVEVTADSFDAVRAGLTQVRDLSGGSAVLSATGSTSNGAGFRTR